MGAAALEEQLESDHCRLKVSVEKPSQITPAVVVLVLHTIEIADDLFRLVIFPDGLQRRELLEKVLRVLRVPFHFSRFPQSSIR